MDASKIDQARATAVSLRGELLALPERLPAMTAGDLVAKLQSLGEGASNLADALKQLQVEVEVDKEY